MQLDLFPPDYIIRVNVGAYEGCTASMIDTNNIYVIILSKLLDDARFRDEELLEIEHVLDATRHTCRIYDTKYQKSDLRKIVLNSKNLSSDEQSMLNDILTKYEFLFDITLGIWKTKPVYIELHQGAKPYHSSSYPVPRAHEAIFRKEVEKLCQLGVKKRWTCRKGNTPLLFN